MFSPARTAAALLCAALLAGLGAGPALADAGPTTPATAQPAPAKKAGSDFGTPWVIGVGLVAGIGGGLFISMNRKRTG
ncbi:LPXTG cell wall anchor domain-containing protein [Kitasatospora sp. LaBMicrA B282]|uniref:LPXTG cell wall anchor domain-containing protein n=1 Tax=Kitasatospora sp. LaBMicrA B282 TaxID=3420949 RepID=UPI003D0D801D